MQGRQYKNPPITEALVEFRVHADEPWTWAVPGRLWERVREDYPESPRQRTQTTMTIGPQPTIQAAGNVDRLYFPAERGTRLMGVGVNVLSIHALKPYRGWGDLFPRVSGGLRAYKQMIPSVTVSRVGVRYIDVIMLPSAELSPSDYIDVGPLLPPGINATTGRFVHRVEANYDDGAVLAVTLTATSAPNAPDRSMIVLDLDLFREFDTPIDCESALQLAEVLHDREGQAFEALIKDSARRLFDT